MDYCNLMFSDLLSVLTQAAVHERSTPPPAAHPACHSRGINDTAHGQRQPTGHHKPTHRCSCAPGLTGGIWGYELEPAPQKRPPVPAPRCRACAPRAPSSTDRSKALCHACAPRVPSGTDPSKALCWACAPRATSSAGVEIRKKCRHWSCVRELLPICSIIYWAINMVRMCVNVCESTWDSGWSMVTNRQ